MHYTHHQRHMICLVILSIGLIPAGLWSEDSRIAGNSDMSIERVDGPVAQFTFDNSLESASSKPLKLTANGTPAFANGLQNQSIRLQSQGHPASLSLEALRWSPDKTRDFSVQFWIRTTMDSSKNGVIVSTKKFPDNSLESQKRRGWVFFVSSGTWAWNMGSGNRRVTYERENGQYMPINDGRWHQLAMTYDSKRSLVRLYYDGKNKATYNVKDSGRFDFANDQGFTIGWNERDSRQNTTNVPAIVQGAKHLQEMVDAFNEFGLPPIEPDEFIPLVNRPARLFTKKLQKIKQAGDPRDLELLESLQSADLSPLERMSKRLMQNRYTVHQSAYYMEVARLPKLYRLVDGKVTIHKPAFNRYAMREVLSRPSFDMDDLTLWDRVLSPGEVLKSYTHYFRPTGVTQQENLKSLSAASWNIYHGGIHMSIEEDGWDSRKAIVELIRRENVDVVMMQETYSSGDFIAAELGYYFATTIDWDNMHQGANISVLSRYPIKEIYVPPSSTFMNVAAKISLSKTQDIYVMSNWYGMRNFPAVFEFHESRFNESDRIPILFGGDFNAVPHTDGGNSLASRKLEEAGFTDAFRSLYPDVQAHPGSTHRSNRRIDQLYYKGAGLKNTSTSVISTWPAGFPSDHYLIKSNFELDYSSAVK